MWPATMTKVKTAHQKGDWLPMLDLSRKSDPATGAGIRRAGMTVTSPDRTHKFITTRRYPIYYLAITKCGSTFLKNLFYALDHDAAHPSKERIHDASDDLVRATDVPGWHVRRSKHAFTVLRSPAGRFLSLYFDKIYGTGPQNFPDLRLKIANEAGLDLAPDCDVAVHRDNTMRLIDWIADNLDGKTTEPVNPHWRPQSRRIGTVEHLHLNFLTLEGLDTQLPLYLGRVVPDLAAKMAMVGARNRSRYPVPPEEVLTRDLTARINEVYAEDAARHRRVSRWWRNNGEAAFARPRRRSGPRIEVQTTHSKDLNVVAQPKCGITYLRNLLYVLDHARMHPEPLKINEDACLVYRRKTAEDLDGALNLFVLRDPVDRFLSLYFDKVWGDGHQAFPWVSERLETKPRFSVDAGTDIEAHQENCLRLVGYLGARFRERPVEALNPHWRPQIVRAEQARPFGFIGLTLDALGPQLRHIATDRISGLDHALLTCKERNASPKPVDADALKTPKLVDRLRALYAEDFALFERIRDGWLTGGTPPEI